MSEKKKKKKQIAKVQDDWGNTLMHKVFCVYPDPHNDGETAVWTARCTKCDHKFNACSECVMDGDCSCPFCGGLAEVTKEQAAKIEEGIASAAWQHIFGKPKLN